MLPNQISVLHNKTEHGLKRSMVRDRELSKPLWLFFNEHVPVLLIKSNDFSFYDFKVCLLLVVYTFFIL